MEGQLVQPRDLTIEVLGDAPTQTHQRAATPHRSRALFDGMPSARRPRADWERRLLRRTVSGDVTAVCVSLAVTWFARYRYTNETLALFGRAFPYSLLALLSLPGFLAALVGAQAYERTVIGGSPEEYTRVVRGVVGLFVVVSAASFLGGVTMSRAVMAVFFPTLLVSALIARFVVRKLLHRRRAHGTDLRRLVLVGRDDAVANIAGHLKRSAHAGYGVVGAYMPSARNPDHDAPGVDVPVLGTPDQLLDDLATLSVDTIALSGSGLFSDASMRSLAWRLHGTGIHLLMAPDLAEIAGPRIVTRPVAGLPMLLVEEPRLDGWGQHAKELIDRAAALVGLVVASPLFAAIAIATKLSSPGPVFYRQTRVARNGDEFSMLKFRSMVHDADTMLGDLTTANRHENDGVLFKVLDDPRVTRVGRVLRRYSLDELPQLINVVRGDMAVVGPRPPLPSEVARYDGDVARRLMVKPGMTGLWQVSGRADLSWEDTVRLDLYYVENWSFTLDLVILGKTLRAVLGGSGAY